MVFATGEITVTWADAVTENRATSKAQNAPETRETLQPKAAVRLLSDKKRTETMSFFPTDWRHVLLINSRTIDIQKTPLVNSLPSLAQGTTHDHAVISVERRRRDAVFQRERKRVAQS